MSTINLVIFWCLTLLIALQDCHGQPSKRQPGAQIQVSQAGLHYAATVAIDVIEKNLDKQSIPDQSGQAKLKVGKVDYWITEIKILRFDKPSSAVTVNPGSGLTWSLQNAGISLNGKWRYQYKWGFIKIKDSGTFDVSVSGTSASVSIKLSTLPNGKPTISMLSCSCSVARVKVKFHGGASWIYNLFTGFVERPLKSALEKEVCKAAEKTINNNVAAQLATLKTSVTIDDKFVIDYSLISNPLFSNGFMQTAHKGEVFYISDPTPAPFTGPYVSTPSPSRMVTAYVNEFVANSFGHVLHKNKVLWYDLTKDDVPENIRPYFQTTCSSEICFGTLFPSAAERYPGATVELNMTTTVTPVLSITSQSITGTIKGRVQVFARLPGGSTGNLLSLAVTLTAKVSPSMRGNYILATVSELTPQISVESSEIGDLPTDGLNRLIAMAINAFIIPKLNEVGAKGLEIPSVAGVTFVGPTVTLTEGAVVVSTDIHYTISSLR